MKKEIVKFDFEGTIVEFGKGEAIWLNATEIAKKFNKHVSHWTSTASTKEYIEALKKRYRNNDNAVNQEFVMVIQGGTGIQGTWIHQKLAIRFAQWLKPDFAVWVDEKIEELITNGSVSLPKDYPSALRALADAEEARMIAEAKAEENKEKAECFELLIEKADNYTLQEAADLLGTGRTRFTKWLKQEKYLQYDRIPYQSSIRSGWFVVKERTVNDIVYHTPMITPKGVEHFTRIRNKGGMNNFLNFPPKTLDIIPTNN